MFVWEVRDSGDCLMTDMRGDIFYIPYSYISDVRAASLVRYCKARFTISRNNYKGVYND